MTKNLPFGQDFLFRKKFVKEKLFAGFGLNIISKKEVITKIKKSPRKK